MSENMLSMLETSAARFQLLKFDSISALSNSILDIIGLARTSQEYHQRFLRTDKNYNFCINFIKMLFNILKIKPIFGDFVIQYRFSMLFDAGLSIVRNRFWVHIRCRFDILKYRAALLETWQVDHGTTGPQTNWTALNLDCMINGPQDEWTDRLLEYMINGPQ